MTKLESTYLDQKRRLAAYRKFVKYSLGGELPHFICDGCREIFEQGYRDEVCSCWHPTKAYRINERTILKLFGSKK